MFGVKSLAERLRALSAPLIALGGVLMAIGAGAPARAAEPVMPAQVRADYVITFNGLELGNFVWDSSFKAGQYKVGSNAKLSALFGAYQWHGVTRAMGSYARGAVRPSVYAFKFKATDKDGQVDMRFTKGNITELKNQPIDRGSTERVAVTRDHLLNVMDPLSAVMALSTPVGGKLDAGSPCTRRIAVFDGKQRFDLALSYLRKEAVQAAGASFAFVCKIRYIPIAGHKNNSETKFMVENTGIEIWLAPIDYANVYVPTNILIPTWAGSVEIASRRVQIDMTGTGKLAAASE